MPPVEQYLWRDLRPVTPYSQQTTLMKKQVHYQILKKTTPTVKKTVLRFIFAKSVYRPKSLEKYDIILMNEVYLSLVDDLIRNASFYNKHCSFFGRAGSRIKFINDLYETSYASKLPTRKHFFQEKDHDYSEPLSPRAFRGLESDAAFQRQYSSLLKMGRESLVRREEKYIGVGYKDKGARRDRATDGSPAWQEVAMARKVLMTNSDWDRLMREIEVESQVGQTTESVDASMQDQTRVPPGSAAKILDFVNEANAPLEKLRILSFGKAAANDDVYIAELD